MDTKMTPKEFNATLKRYLKARGMESRVRIVNSYNWPKCYVQVWGSQYTNELRLKVFDTLRLKREDLHNPENVSYGTIQPNSISTHAIIWAKVFEFQSLIDECTSN